MSRITTEEALGDITFALDALRAMKNPSDEVAMAVFNLTDAKYYLERSLIEEKNVTDYISVSDADYNLRGF